MRNPGHVPDELRHGPFTLAQAAVFGISRYTLRGSSWRRISHGWYRWIGCPMSEELRLRTIWPRLPPGSAFSGATAARLHGLDVPLPRRPEATVPFDTGIADRIQAVVRRVELLPDDVVRWKDLRITSPLRTLFDLTGRSTLIEGVVVADMAFHAGFVDPDDFGPYLIRHAKLPGVARARRVLDHADPRSESPMESRLRMLLVAGGLPRPEAQVDLVTGDGVFVARADLYYREAALVVEYDGENHRDRLISDDRRQNRLQDAGFRLLRYTGADVTDRREAIVAEVGRALSNSARLSAKGP